MGIDPISIGLSALQGGLGLVQTLTGNSELKSLARKRTAYNSPEEIEKILNLALSGAGGDTATRDFQSNQLDRAFAGMANVAQRLGADPNNISGLFEQLINGKMKIGNEFHASNMEAVGKVVNAFNLVADNKTAEWRSEQDIIKDKMQAAAGKVQAGYQNISGGLNTALSTYQSDKANNLYK